jgi:hypothetical protein
MHLTDEKDLLTNLGRQAVTSPIRWPVASHCVTRIGTCEKQKTRW